MTKVQEIIKNKPYLAWYIKDPMSLSIESSLEHVLNYGDWDDFQNLIGILGVNKAARMFYSTINKKRSNYKPEIQSYFQSFFQKYAH